MTIEVNGRPVELGDGASVSDALERAGASQDAGGVAVAVDGEVVPRSEWGSMELREGQVVEVVGAVQGG
jgi:sulfur carrier protein